MLLRITGISSNFVFSFYVVSQFPVLSVFVCQICCVLLHLETIFFPSNIWLRWKGVDPFHLRLKAFPKYNLSTRSSDFKFLNWDFKFSWTSHLQHWNEKGTWNMGQKVLLRITGVSSNLVFSFYVVSQYPVLSVFFCQNFCLLLHLESNFFLSNIKDIFADILPFHVLWPQIKCQSVFRICLLADLAIPLF